ncbi:MAG TPA: hypothetical protein VGR87_02000 [Candidatus Limnocylindria bacterium]|nr:hypothetical protein [Candidatus Limnocylindria bacterium]
MIRDGRILAWSLLLLVAGALALRALAMWLGALLSGGPVLYGEGAVAHAGQILARGGDPYALETDGGFVAANYPPLAFAVGALGSALGPFVGLRLAGICATLAVAFAAARLAGFGVAGVALGVSWVALFPVEIWGAAVKPDPLAVALTAFAVIAAGQSRTRAGLAGVLAALAILAKPTAALPLAALAVYLAVRERPTLLRAAMTCGLTLAAALALVVARSGLEGPLEHVVRRNALGFSVEALSGLIVVGILSLGASALLAARVAEGRFRAYLIGATAVILLGGREGATINYLLDFGAASTLALAASAGTLRTYAPLAIAAQLALAVLVFHPFEPAATTGAWGDPRRSEQTANLGPLSRSLAEDSGVLVANGIEPEVDDLFLWARLVTNGSLRDQLTARVRSGEFTSVFSEVDLSALDSAPAYERQRWIPPLVSAMLETYRLDSIHRGLYRYALRPR